MQALIKIENMQVGLLSEAYALRDAALEAAALIGTVKTAQENDSATEAMKSVKRVMKQVEDARKAVKGPVWDLCTRIDATAKEFVADLASEELRLAKAVGNYQQEQLEIQRAAARKAAEEAARIERERMEAQRKIEDEQRRVEAEARAKAAAEMAAARNAADRAAAEARAKAEQARIAAEAEARQKIEAERAAQQLQAIPAAIVGNKAAGQVVREVWDFEVSNVWDLVRARPDLVSIEPRRREIGEAVALMAATGEPKIPGLRIWKEVKAGVRLGAERKSIDV